MAGYCLMRSPGGDRDGIDTVVHVGLGGPADARRRSTTDPHQWPLVDAVIRSRLPSDKPQCFVDLNQSPSWTADPEKVISGIRLGYAVLDSIH
jgi:hypothetical protein